MAIAPPEIEHVALDDALGRVLARPIVADDDYPNARAFGDGRLRSRRERDAGQRLKLPVRSEWASRRARPRRMPRRLRIPTGGVLPDGADAVVPFEDARARRRTSLSSTARSIPAQTSWKSRADMRRGEIVLQPERRVRAAEIGVLATLGITAVPVYRRPIDRRAVERRRAGRAERRPRPGQIRDSNRYAVAASLRAMGAIPRHYPTLRDEAGEFESALATALSECDAVAVTGGSSVGDRDRLPRAVAAIASPGVVVHGLRVKPGKPTLFGADGMQADSRVAGKPDLGLADPGSGRRADRRGADRRADRRAVACGAPGSAGAQPRRAGRGTFRSRCRMMAGRRSSASTCRCARFQ